MSLRETLFLQMPREVLGVVGFPIAIITLPGHIERVFVAISVAVDHDVELLGTGDKLQSAPAEHPPPRLHEARRAVGYDREAGFAGRLRLVIPVGRNPHHIGCGDRQ
jgi:hypothetical protein